MSRRRSTPWIHRWSRLLIGAIAILGALDAAYLTLIEVGVFKEAAFCPTTGAINCQAVLLSEYSQVFGIPLSLFGFLAYISMAVFALAPQFVKLPDNKTLKANLEEWSWLLIFAGSTAMVVFSGYLLSLMTFQIKAFCLYCLASVLFSVSLFVLALIGRTWDDIGQILFIGIVVGMVALIGSLGLYATVNKPIASNSATVGELMFPIVNPSGEAEIALAKHLQQKGVKMYGAYWCPHCHEQKELFGKEAFHILPYVECADPKDPQKQLDVCSQAGIKGYPTWEINGKLEPNLQTLEKLAELTGYQGSTKFKYKFPPG